MRKVIECLQNKVNGVLESPTGTGKTLCLLCSALGWRENFKDTISDCKIAERMDGVELFPDRPMSSRGTAVTNKDTPTYDTDIPKIIYASRTHSQLAQVINELKNISYRPNICVLGSREQLCIDQEVMRQESNHIKVHMCRAKVSSRSCVFYNNVDEKSTYKEIMNTIMDVEDLVKTCKKERVCPYYLSRSLKQHADVIFMPYNYLLDPKSRRAHNIELKGAVVIFDEAHNIEKMCEESTSFDLSPHDLISAIEAVDRLLLKLDITTIAKIKQILMDLGSSINGFEMPANNQGITKPGSFIYELFQMANVNFENKTAIVEAMEQITGYLAGRPGVFLNTSGLQKVADIIQLVFGAKPTEDSKTSQMGNGMKEFKVHIHPVTNNFTTKQQTDLCASSSTKKQGNVLSYWCFSPGFSMQELLGQGVRSIILTSGTLSPLSSFTCEMKIPFPVSLENLHVIQPDQISVSIIEKGPDGVKLSTAFDRRFVPENMSSMGNTLVNLTRLVPHGLLVFFPSYPVMDKTLEFWRASGHAGRIEKVKPMFVEPRGKGTFTEVIDGYYAKLKDPNSSGGSFFAVCRGKASEGLDFADTYCRGVVVTGLPFPPMMDPRVVLKMQYLDEMCKNNISGVKVPALQNAQLCFFYGMQILYPCTILCFCFYPCLQIKSVFSKSDCVVLESEEQSGSDGDAQMFIQYEMDIDRKPVSLLDVPDDTTNKVREDTMVGEERASHFSSLSLQHDKRLDRESRVGKRKIKVVQQRAGFFFFLKKTFSPNLFKLLSCYQGLYQFVRPHHKKEFDQRCLELTGKGCGYKPELSLSREDQEALRQNTAEIPPESPPKEQPNSSRQLNQGGDNIGGILDEDQNPKTSIQEGLSCSSLLSGIKQAIGAEKTHQLFSALQAYKNSNNYEQMVSTVVSLLTERNEDITILKRLTCSVWSRFITSPLSAGKSQSKISSFS
uniref:Regulator of telomere elongation helicase 1 n=1 Tax=Cyprinus carpio TaxID=7962 RepID=A0A8C1TF07_CYPCA